MGWPAPLSAIRQFDGFGHVRPGFSEVPDAAKFGSELYQRSWALHRDDVKVLRRALSGPLVSA
jgi:hypothetical protein